MPLPDLRAPVFMGRADGVFFHRASGRICADLDSGGCLARQFRGIGERRCWSWRFAAELLGLADNVVRPLLLRNRTSLNDLLLFISILGGLRCVWVARTGRGPTIVAAALGVFRVYMAHREELETAQTGRNLLLNRGWQNLRE